MEQLAKLLTEQLVKKGADYQKRDIYQYALEYFLSTVIGILGIITIATLSIGTYPWYLIPAIFHAYKIRSRRLPCKNISWVFFSIYVTFCFGNYTIQVFIYGKGFTPIPYNYNACYCNLFFKAKTHNTFRSTSHLYANPPKPYAMHYIFYY